jgi:hypothetical protein
MAIYGTVVLEDSEITFTCDENCVAHWTIRDTFLKTEESKHGPQKDFLAALAIAVHNDGEPDFNKDYPAAESIQGNIRWIP